MTNASLYALLCEKLKTARKSCNFDIHIENKFAKKVQAIIINENIVYVD